VTLVIEELRDRAGVIYQSRIDPSGESFYSIVQDSFGEYLAARHLVGTTEKT
jgi:hypothetical protein